MAAQPSISALPQPIETEENANLETPQALDKEKLEINPAAHGVSSKDDKQSEDKPSNLDGSEVKSKSRKVTFGEVQKVPEVSLPAPTAQDDQSDEDDEDYPLSDGDEEVNEDIEDNIPPEEFASAIAEVSSMLKGRLKSFIDSGTLGSKPLHAAAASNDVSKLHELLREGSDYHDNINDVDVFQYNALHVAAERGSVEACKVLIELGIDKNATTRMHQSTALHYAAFEGHDDVMAALLEADVDIDAVTDDGRTALYQASLRGHTHCVDFLLRNGANRDIKTKAAKTAVQVASNEEITSMFQEPVQKKARTKASNT